MKNIFKKPQNKKHILGGICAAALPFLIGIILFAIPIIAEGDPSCTFRAFRAKNTSAICGIYQNIGEEFYWFIMLPIILSFIFVAPIVALMSISDLRTRAPITWRDIFITSMAKSTKANFWVALAYNIILTLILLVTSIGTADLGSVLGILVIIPFYAAVVQFGLWICITLPLALICATIFGTVVRPKKTS